jgi:ribosomal protein S18 acetylase RimI-like enzyme
MKNTTHFKIKEFTNLAKHTNVFKKIELQDLSDMLSEFKKYPDIEYSMIESRQKPGLEGFILFGISPMSKNTWDIYWISVDKNAQGRGLGKRLIEAAENKINKSSKSKPSIRIETSSRKEYHIARHLYESMHYKMIGILPNYYGPKDDMIIFHKTLK